MSKRYTSELVRIASWLLLRAEARHLRPSRYRFSERLENPSTVLEDIEASDGKKAEYIRDMVVGQEGDQARASYESVQDSIRCRIVRR